MLRVERTQISLDTKQADRLRRLARERGTSMAALIREAVDEVFPADATDSLEARWARALASVGGFHSGLTDVAERHDDYFVEAIEASDE
jgi:hypothetical protein